jgi:hypothetical protein
MSAAIDLSAVVSRQDISMLMRQMNRAQKELGMDIKKSMQMAGRLVAQSLSASTKLAPKTRPIVKNPDSRSLTDNRMAKFGVMRYDKSGKKVFRGIYRTGEFGKIRFMDKNTMSWFERDPGGGKWNKIQSGPDPANPEILVPGIKTDKRRNIGRRGLAKKAWQLAASNIRASGSFSGKGVSDISSVDWTGSAADPTLTISSNLRYAAAAFKTKGDKAVSSALERAGNRMRKIISDKISKRLGAK